MRLLSLFVLLSFGACAVNAPAGPDPFGDGGVISDAGVDPGNPSQDAAQPRPECTDDRMEANDNREAAAAVAQTEDVNLVACPGNEDWYWIQTANDERARVRLEHDGAGDVDLQILNQDGEFAVSVERGGRDIVSEWIGRGSKFFVLVTNPSRRASAYTLSVEREAVRCRDDRYENNNNANGAERITGGDHPDLTFCGDPDYYRFTAPADSQIRATVEGSERLVLELLNDSGDQVIATAQSSDEGLALVHQSTRDGVYFLRVSGPEELQTDYAMQLERQVEGNNSCEQAEVIELTRNERVVVEGSTRGKDNTYEPSCGHRNNEPRSAGADAVYALVVPEGGGTIIADMVARTEGFDPVLSIRSACDDVETELNCNDDHRGGNDMGRTDARIEEGVEAGTYYLIADGFRTTSGNFELRVTLEYEEPDPGPACETAQSIDVPREGRVEIPIENEDARRQYAPLTCADRSGAQGRERAYTFTLQNPAQLTAYTAFSDRGESYDTVLYLLRGCGGLDEIACHDDISGDNKLSRIEDLELAAGAYTIVADAFYERNVGAVNLVMDFSAP